MRTVVGYDAHIDAGVAAQAQLDALAMPRGSLGQFEHVAVELARASGTSTPQGRRRRLVIFAGDHGVVAEAVGVWPQSVTRAIMRLIIEGRAVCSSIAEAVGAPVQLVDVGSIGPALAGACYSDCRIAEGTRNLAVEPAMTVTEFDRAFEVGRQVARNASSDGIQVLAMGEVGIGNTTVASIVTALLTGAQAHQVVGPGAGATPETLARKAFVVSHALACARELLTKDIKAAIAAVGGFELVAMAGCIVEAAERGIVIVLDGFVVGAAALIAKAVAQTSVRSCIAAHRGAEPGHHIVLAELGLQPILHLDLRLGEGTGGLLVLPWIDAAGRLLTDVATLEEAAQSPAGPLLVTQS